MTVVSQKPQYYSGTTSTREKLEAIYSPDNQRSLIRYVDDIETLSLHIDRLKEQNKRLAVSFFWGPHPERMKPNRADKRTLNTLQSMFDGIIETDITVILADYHGRVNGIDNGNYLSGIKNYIDVLNSQIHSGSIRAISLDGLYEMFNIGAPNPSTVDLDSYVLDKLQISSQHFDSRAEPHVYVSMRRNELAAVDTITAMGDGVLVAITEPDQKVIDSIFDGLSSQLLVIRGANKSGTKYSDTPPWIPHNGVSNNGSGNGEKHREHVEFPQNIERGL